MLMSAAENDLLQSCKWLLEHGADVNKAMPATGWTALHAAAKKGNLEVVQLLVKAGADSHKQAGHRDFGKGCKASDVTVDAAVLKLLKDC